MNELAGTKELIFDAFIEMSSSFGYENVTMRDIAKKVGIHSSSIYYHYESKEMILTHVYDYYSTHYFDTRIPIEEMKKLIETSNPEEFIFALARNFVSDDQKKSLRMILITKIIYMRLFQDSAANAMFANHNASDSEYVVSILQHGIEVGRIQPDFDLEVFAAVVTGSMMAMGIVAFADPSYIVGLLDHETRVRSMLAKLFAAALIQA